ncbi:MAG TPA: hypothetical protein VGL80_14145 [Pseudonocardiaceae bacterium]
MKTLKKAAIVVAGLGLAGGLAFGGVASAALPTPVAANVVAIPLTRIVNVPGDGLTNGGTVSVQVAGTHGIPVNATAVEGLLSVYEDTGVSRLSVETDGTGAPGTPTVIGGRTTTAQPSGAGEAFHVALSTTGKLAVHNVGAATRFLLAVSGYDIPTSTCQSSLFTITPQTVTLHNVGGSIRTGATDAGSVQLPAGTYDTRVLGNFFGLNNTDDAAFAGHQLFGTMVLVKGPAILPDFSNDITDGGHLIDQADSATLTVDPTTQVSTFLTLTESTEIHVMFFAALDNSGATGTVGQPGEGAVTAAVQSAQFRSVC